MHGIGADKSVGSDPRYGSLAGEFIPVAVTREDTAGRWTRTNCGSLLSFSLSGVPRPGLGEARCATQADVLQRAEIDVDYLDSLSLSISTAVLANIPRPRFAVLPVSLGVELASIGGTVSCGHLC